MSLNFGFSMLQQLCKLEFVPYPQGVSLGLHHARSVFFTTVRSRFFTAGFSPLFTRPQAVKKLLFQSEPQASLNRSPRQRAIAQ